MINLIKGRAIVARMIDGEKMYLSAHCGNGFHIWMSNPNDAKPFETFRDALQQLKVDNKAFIEPFLWDYIDVTIDGDDIRIDGDHFTATLIDAMPFARKHFADQVDPKDYDNRDDLNDAINDWMNNNIDDVVDICIKRKNYQSEFIL